MTKRWSPLQPYRRSRLSLSSHFNDHEWRIKYDQVLYSSARWNRFVIRRERSNTALVAAMSHWTDTSNSHLTAITATPWILNTWRIGENLQAQITEAKKLHFIYIIRLHRLILYHYEWKFCYRFALRIWREVVYAIFMQ